MSLKSMKQKLEDQGVKTNGLELFLNQIALNIPERSTRDEIDEMLNDIMTAVNKRNEELAEQLLTPEGIDYMLDRVYEEVK